MGSGRTRATIIRHQRGSKAPHRNIAATETTDEDRAAIEGCRERCAEMAWYRTFKRHQARTRMLQARSDE